MAEEFAKVEGLRLIAGGSDNHLLNLKVLDLGINGKKLKIYWIVFTSHLIKKQFLMKHYHHLKLQGANWRRRQLHQEDLKKLKREEKLHNWSQKLWLIMIIKRNLREVRKRL